MNILLAGMFDFALDVASLLTGACSLTQIYSNLCAICSQPKVVCKQPSGGHQGNNQIKRLSNLYEGLNVEDDPNLDGERSDEVPESCNTCNLQPLQPCPGPQKDIRIADDDLGNVLELASCLQETCKVLGTVDDVWRHAARDDVHFVTAAFATHAAYSQLLKIDQRMRDLEDNISVATLREKCGMLMNEEPEDGAACWHKLLGDLLVPEKSIQHYTGEHNATPMDMVVLQRPVDYIRSGSESESDSFLTPALIENIMALIRSPKAPSAVVRNSTPVYAELGYALCDPQEAAVSLRLLLGVEVLKRSYESYVLASPQPALVSKCRLTALRLAQSAASSVHAIIRDQNCFPCRCTQTVAFHLQHLGADLTEFATQKRFDLYFQSPYVAGSHILEMLDLCHYYGSKLFVYRHYVGALVHSYNVLRQLAALEEIPLLEALCELFQETWFPGGVRPTKSFRGSWTRYIGARLKFKKGHRRNRQDSWCMAIPPHAARKAAGLGVGRNEAGNEKSSCMLFTIKQQDYAVSDAQWEHMRAASGFEDTDASQLRQLLPMVEAEINPCKATGSRPLSKARLNYFDVFRDCVRVVRDISDATHTDAKERGMNCICFASALLEGADRIVDARALGKLDGKGACWTTCERDGVLKTTMEAMRSVLGGREVETWSWAF